MKGRIKLLYACIVILIILLGMYDLNWGLLFVSLLFQVVSILSIIQTIKDYRKTRSGIFAEGKIIEVRKIKPEEERASNYEYRVVFFNPLTNERGELYSYESSLWPQDVIFKIWVDPVNIEKSIILDGFVTSRIVGVSVSILIIAGLVYGEFVLIERMFK